ncbi:flagellar hook-length control protein FliK [Niallia sp. 03133]|uniref:flagellar hook-length control protein FliK n=1 Tax=Niallia sp. 03133 TaxID=3458060 RepID=UPI0040448471
MQVGINRKEISPYQSNAALFQSPANSQKFNLLFNTLAMVKGSGPIEHNLLIQDEENNHSLSSILRILTNAEPSLTGVNINADPESDDNFQVKERILQLLHDAAGDDYQDLLDMDDPSIQLDQIIEKAYSAVTDKLYDFLSTFHFEQTNNQMFADTEFPKLVDTIKILLMVGKETSLSNKQEEVPDIVESLTNLIVNLLNQTKVSEQEKRQNNQTFEKKERTFYPDSIQGGKRKILEGSTKGIPAINLEVSSQQIDSLLKDQNRMINNSSAHFIEKITDTNGMKGSHNNEKKVDAIFSNLNETNKDRINKLDELIGQLAALPYIATDRKEYSPEIMADQKNIKQILISIKTLLGELLDTTRLNELQTMEPEKAEVINLHNDNLEKQPKNPLHLITPAELLTKLVQRETTKPYVQETEASNGKSGPKGNREEQTKDSVRLLAAAELIELLVKDGLDQSIIQQSESKDINSNSVDKAGKQPNDLVDQLSAQQVEFLFGNNNNEISNKQPGLLELEHTQTGKTEAIKQEVSNTKFSGLARHIDSIKPEYPSNVQSVLLFDDKQRKYVNKLGNEVAISARKGDTSSISKNIKSLVSSIIDNLTSITNQAGKPKEIYPKLINPILMESLQKKASNESTFASFFNVNQEPIAEKKKIDTTSFPIGQLQTSFSAKQHPLLVLSSNGNPVSSNQLEEQLQKIFANASYMKNGDSQKFILRLAPEHLGTIKIEVFQNEGAIVAKIFTATAEAKELLDSHLSSLKHGLSTQNIVVDKMEIVYTPAGQQDKMGREQQSQQQQQQQQKQEQEDTSQQQQNKQKKSFLEELLNMET